MNPRTLATTVRCDARDAAMALYLCEKHDLRVHNVSDLFRSCVSIVAELAVHKGLVPRITETTQAVSFLRQKQIIDLLNKSRPNHASLVKALAEEDGVTIHPTGASPEDIQRALDRMKQDSEDLSSLRSTAPTHVVGDEEDNDADS